MRAEIRRDLRLLLAVAPSVRVVDLPECLLRPRELRERAREVMRSGDRFEAWRLGWIALAMTGRDRARMLDSAIAAFARIVSTPAGPGNDDGPFCDFAHALSARQARRALQIALRMKDGGWRTEAGSAIAVLAARLFALGEVPAARRALSVLDDEDQAFCARTLIGALPGRAARRLDRASVDDVAAWTRTECAERWRRWVRAPSVRSNPISALSRPAICEILRRLGGEASVSDLRALLLRGGDLLVGSR